MKIYFNPNARCMRCDYNIKATRHVVLYLVGNRAAIAYMLCNTCGPKARSGLPPEEQCEIDAKLEAQAKSLGLTETH